MGAVKYLIIIIMHCVGEHGGGYGPQATADYLFSESATSNDTILVYQETSIAVFHPEFITAILVEKTSLADIPIAKYLLLPPYTTTAQQIIATPSKHKTIKQLPKHKPVNNNNNNNKPTAVQSSKDSTHVRYYTSNDSIKGTLYPIMCMYRSPWQQYRSPW